jgi:hypothetical protein
MVIVKATEDSEAGVMPSEELLTEMGKFNEELVEAGVMLAGDGLRPSPGSRRTSCAGGSRSERRIEAGGLRRAAGRGSSPVLG